ncbi:MAG: hypothetical protein GXO22_06105 [Aquificae bacterium]|nr:hypothetical protein [Aquificota bacterium]
MFDKIAKSKTLKFVLFITAFAFVGTGLVALIVYQIAGGAITGAAIVNDREISFQELQREYNNLAKNLESQGIDTTPMRKMLYSQALENLIAKELLYQEAEKEGIVATQEEIKMAILSYEAFYENGKFSKEKYLSILKSAGLNPAMFEQMIKKDLTTKHIITLLKSSFYITDEEIDSFSIKQLTKISGKVYIFPVSTEITEEEIKKYYEENKDKFTGKKGKKIVIYKIDIDKLGKEKAQNLARELYQNIKQNKQIPQKEGIQKLFDNVIFLDKEENLDKKFIKEVKKLSKEKNISLLKEKDAFYLIKYEGEHSKPLPLEKVKDKIIAQLSTEKREKASKELLNKIKEELKKEKFENIVQKYKPKTEDFQKQTLQILSAKYGLSNEAIKSIFKLPPKSVSEPFLSRAGVIIIEITEKELPSKEEIEKARKSLIKFVENEKFNTYIQMYIDRLKKESDIRINPRVLN